MTLQTHIEQHHSNKSILRYVKVTLDIGLLFKVSKSTALIIMVNSDWVSDPDDRRSTTGSCIFLGPNLVSWISKKQPSLAIKRGSRVSCNCSCHYGASVVLRVSKRTGDFSTRHSNNLYWQQIRHVHDLDSNNTGQNTTHWYRLPLCHRVPNEERSTNQIHQFGRPDIRSIHQSIVDKSISVTPATFGTHRCRRRVLEVIVTNLRSSFTLASTMENPSYYK